MTSKNDAYLKTAKLTFTRVCTCGMAGCIDCRSWITESDIPFHLHGPIMSAMANTIGVDMLRLVNQRYTIVTVIASAFEASVVLQSIRENVASAGLVNCFTGLRADHQFTQQPEKPTMPADLSVAEGLNRCVDALTKAAAAMEAPQVVQIGPHTIVHGARRYLQIYPIPAKRSWWRQQLLCWLAD